MPRRSRTLSRSGVYHIMIRGNEREKISKIQKIEQDLLILI